jgi:hypothetical protein
LQAVREMFLNTDVFITFHIRGSRAGWASSRWYVFPLAPGVSGGAFDESKL